MRHHIGFDRLWMQNPVPFSMFLRAGDFGWSCGQCPLDRAGQVVAPGDALAQTRLVAGYAQTLLAESGFARADLARLRPAFAWQGLPIRTPGRRSPFCCIRSDFVARDDRMPILRPDKDGIMTRIEIYTTPTCPYCHAAKQLLRKKGVPYQEIDVSRDPDLRIAMTKRAGGSRTVPQIFIDGAHIGGCDDMYALDQVGGLDPLLAT